MDEESNYVDHPKTQPEPLFAESRLAKPRVTGSPASGSDEALERDLPDIVAAKYKVIELLGRGGMGSVYKVQHIHLGSIHAMKVLTSVDSSSLARFQSEARINYRLEHKNLVAVSDLGMMTNQAPFLVMDYVEGEPLSALIKEKGRLPWSYTRNIFLEVCDGLSYAHHNGIIHRDLKPSNFMLCNHDMDAPSVKIVDFGIAKIITPEGLNQQALTKTGEVFGSPLYMSPEQCAAASVDERSDLYSLGCAIFETLTGTPPFVGDNALATIMKHQFDIPPDLQELVTKAGGRKIPEPAVAIVNKLLAKESSERYQSVAELKKALQDTEKSQDKPSGGIVTFAKRHPLATILTLAGAGLLLSFAPLALIPNKVHREPPRVKEADFPHHVVEHPPLVTEYFAKIPLSEARKNGHTWTFNFPKTKDTGLGALCISKTMVGPYAQARGEVTLPVAAPIQFKAIGILQYPELFKWFRSDEIAKLELDSKFIVMPKDTLRCIEHLQGLTYLEVDSSGLSDDELEHIDRLKGLEFVSMNYNEFTARKLSTTGLCLRLRALHAKKLRGGTHELVKALASSNALKEVELDQSELEDRDLATLATSRVLKRLSVAGCPNITDAGIAALASSATIKYLDLLGCKITPASIKYFARIKNLRELFIDQRSWTDSEKSQLQEQLKKCDISEIHKKKSDE